MDYMRLLGLAGRENSATHDALTGALKETWHSLPGIISKDGDGHTATVSSALKILVRDITGAVTSVQIADFDTAPVHFPGGGGVTHTHPVKKGDEGLVLFSSAAQDLWHQKGGIQDTIDGRRHHLADGRWQPGGRSDPRKLNPPPSTTSQQSRADDGTHVWDLHPANGLTASSTKKHLVIVGGSSGAGTLHLPSGQILKNAAKVLINCIQQDPLPPPGNSFANKKLIALKPVGAMGSGAQSAGIASIMTAIAGGGGAASIFASPIAGNVAGLSSAISAAATAVAGVAGSGGLVSTLTGSLTTALGSLATTASNFSGASAPTGANFGLSDLLAHVQGLSTYYGTGPIPAQVSLAQVFGPLQSGPALDTLSASIASMAAEVVALAIPPSAGVAEIAGMITQLNIIVNDAVSSITALQNAKPLLDLALALASAGVSQDPNEQALAAVVANPALAALTALVGDVFALSGDDIANATSFPDATADSAGATGGL